jgi:hypothetical protein
MDTYGFLLLVLTKKMAMASEPHATNPSGAGRGSAIAANVEFGS